MKKKSFWVYLFFPIIGLVSFFLFQNYWKLNGIASFPVNSDTQKTDALNVSAKANRSIASSSTAAVTIDASQSLGKFSPYLFGQGHSSTDESVDLAHSAGFKIAHIYVDIGDGTNCNFVSEKEPIDALLKAGIAIMPVFDPARKPDNLDTYADCVKKAGKYFFNKGIKIFRFSNEPDGSWTKWGDSGKQSDPVDVAKTYAVWAKALKSVDKSIIVEGPAIMTITENDQPDEIADWVKKFLNYCSENKVPLDIFSFHIYSPYPYEFYKKFNLVKKEIKKHKISPLYGVPKLGNDEWLIMCGDAWTGQYNEQFDKTWAAAAQISGLINMIEEGAVLSMPTFGIDLDKDLLCHDFLPISCSGKAKPTFYAFQAFNQLAKTKRLKISGTDKMNFAAIAGIQKIKGNEQIIVILSNYDALTYRNTFSDFLMEDLLKKNKPLSNAIEKAEVYNSFSLRIENTPWKNSKSIIAKRYLIDDDNALVLADDQSITVEDDKSISLNAEISAPQIQIITLSLKDKSSLFSMDPVLAADENYGKTDVLAKENFERIRRGGEASESTTTLEK